MAGGGAGGDAPDAQASALGLPSGQPQPPKRPSVLPIMGYNESRWSSARSLVKSCVVVCRNDFLTSMYPKSLPDTLSRLIFRSSVCCFRNCPQRINPVCWPPLGRAIALQRILFSRYDAAAAGEGG